MRMRKFNSQSGVSLIEVLIVLAISAVLVSLAVAQLSSSKTNLQRQRIAREFKVYLERVRFDSVKRRADFVRRPGFTNPFNDMSRIILTSSTSFTAVTDLNQNGTVLDANGNLEEGDKRVVDFTQRSDTRIFVSDTFDNLYPITISFDRRGHITALDKSNNAVNPVFTICSTGNCSESSPEITVISVSTTGTVAVSKTAPGLSSLPTPAPISTATPQFNCYVIVNSNSTQCLNK